MDTDKLIRRGLELRCSIDSLKKQLEEVNRQIVEAAEFPEGRSTAWVQGKGCHGSTPEKGVDPITIASHIVINLQEILAREIAAATQGRDVFLCLRQDMAKALGQALAGILVRDAAILCIDRIRVGEGSFLDIGAPVGSALPVVVKTLVLSK